MASEHTSEPEASSVPLESVDKPHWHEVSSTLQVYLLVFTIIFVVVIGEFQLEGTSWRGHVVPYLWWYELRTALCHHIREREFRIS